MKFTIPSDHPLHKEAKVGDLLTVTAKVTESGDEVVVEVDKVEMAEPAKARATKKKMTPAEYLMQMRKKPAAA